MPSPVNKPIRFSVFGLVLLMACSIRPVFADTKAYPIHDFFLQEPVFGGQARIVEAGSAKAPLIVLVHGLNESADMWYPFIPTLAQHLHVLSFDLPGFGQSSKANKLYSPDNYVAFIRFVLSRYPAQPIMLVGHSLGGNIALRYAATYPLQVDRLMLVDAAGVLHRLSFSKFLSHFGIQVLPSLYPGQTQDLQSLANGILGALTQYSSIADLGETAILKDPTLREQLLAGYPPAIATHAMMMTEFTNILDNFRVPTLFVWGEQDEITPIRTAKMLAANFDNAGLIVIAHAGHTPMVDAPAAFAQVLVQFATADATQRDALLQHHRYAAPNDNAAQTDRIGNCERENNKVFRGRYKRVVIDRCQDVILQSVIADSIVIKDSQANIENCRLKSSGNGLLLQNSKVTVTACRIQGSPAIAMSNSKLDIAGSHIVSTTEAIKESAAGIGSDILFSITQLNSREQKRLMHGPLSLTPNQAL